MPVITRRRAAALAKPRPSALKKTPVKPRRRPNQTLSSIKTHEPKRASNGKLTGSRRRLKSISSDDESFRMACEFGHRLYLGEAPLDSAATISPKLKSLLSGGVEQQARFYERKLAQVSADLAASGERELWRVHEVVDVALGMLRGIGRM
ncbi:hypothetical protein Q7P37_005678 [Cladosporium fusiforme]